MNKEEAKIIKLANLVESEGSTCRGRNIELSNFYTCDYCGIELYNYCSGSGTFFVLGQDVSGEHAPTRFELARKELKKISKEEIFELLL